MPALLTLVERATAGDWHQQAVRISVACERGERIHPDVVRAVLRRLALSPELRTVGSSFERCLTLGLRLHTALDALFGALRQAESADFDLAMRAVRTCADAPGARMLRTEMAKRGIEPSTAALVDALETFDRRLRLDWSEDSARAQARAWRTDVAEVVEALRTRSLSEEVQRRVVSVHLRILCRSPRDRKLFLQRVRGELGLDLLVLNPFAVTEIEAADLDTCIRWLTDEGRYDAAIAVYETLRRRIRDDSLGVGALAASKTIFDAAVASGQRLVACHYLDALVKADRRPRRALRDTIIAARPPSLSPPLAAVAELDESTTVEAGEAVTAAVRAMLDAIRRRRLFGTGQLRARRVITEVRETIRVQQRRLRNEIEWHVASTRRRAADRAPASASSTTESLVDRIRYAPGEFCAQLQAEIDALAVLNRELKQHRFKLMTAQSFRSLVANPRTGQPRDFAEASPAVRTIMRDFQLRYAARVGKRRRAFFKKRVRAAPLFGGWLKRYRPAGTGRTVGRQVFRRNTQVWRPLRQAVRRQLTARRGLKWKRPSPRPRRSQSDVERVQAIVAHRRQVLARRAGVEPKKPRTYHQIERRRRSLQHHLGRGDVDGAVERMRKWQADGRAPTLRPPRAHAAMRDARRAKYQAWRVGGQAAPRSASPRPS